MLGGAAAAQGAAAVTGQVGQLAGLKFQCRPYLCLEFGEFGSVVRADDAGVGCSADLGVPDQVGEPPVSAEAVSPRLFDLGVQVGQPRPPSGGEQRVAA